MKRKKCWFSALVLVTALSWANAAVVVTLPRAVIAIEGEPIATTGRPALTSSLGVAVRFE